MMNALRQTLMHREEFFDWAEALDIRYEFDGVRPVAMTGGTINYSQITQNIQFALRTRLAGSGCRPLGPDAGVATTGDAVRYPDALVTCTKAPGDARIVPGVVVVFEVLSPTSGRIDRIEKLREYRAVPSILRYVIVEYSSIGLVVYERADGAEPWRAAALTDGDVLDMPEIGISLPISEVYESVDFGPGVNVGRTLDR